MRDIFSQGRTFSRKIAAGALLAVLAGCTTAKDMAVLGDGLVAEAQPAATSGKTRKARSGYVDPMVANAYGYDAAEPLPEYATADGETAGDLGQVIMQRTAVNAEQSSIFSAYQATGSDFQPVAPETPASLVPSGLPQQNVNASTFSLFSLRRPATTGAQALAPQ